MKYFQLNVSKNGRHLFRTDWQNQDEFKAMMKEMVPRLLDVVLERLELIIDCKEAIIHITYSTKITPTNYPSIINKMAKG